MIISVGERSCCRIANWTAPSCQIMFTSFRPKPHGKLSEDSVIAYVQANPVNAGLALNADDWPWSSASKDTGGKTAGAPNAALPARSYKGSWFVPPFRRWREDG